MNHFYSGISGLVLPFPNKILYPLEFQDKPRLNYYASLFTSIEINSSFYKIPLEATVSKWAEIVPDHFKFTFKLWREITHNKGLTFSLTDVQRFMKTINKVETKKGCLLVQFPPSLKVSYIAQLQDLISTIRESDPEHDWKIALEFRHSSWYSEELMEFLDENIAIVIQDIPSSATPIAFAKGKFVYLRFHGPEGKYRGTYSESFLQEYSTYIKEWLEEEKILYAYFNNTMGDAVKNLAVLNQMVLSKI